MDKLDKNITITLDSIKKELINNKDIVIKEVTFNNTNISFVFSECLSDRSTINDFVLEFFNELRVNNIKTNNLLKYIENNIPTSKITKTSTYNELLYYVLSGFIVILIDGYDEALAIETKSRLDSGISEAKNEKVMKGPRDSFTENYQVNVGLIKKRIKDPALKLEEEIVGSKSKTKVGIMYVDDLASQEIVDYVISKIKDIDLDGVFDTNYIMDTISGNEKNILPNYISTERPDIVGLYLLEGRIAIVVENTPYVIVIPAVFIDFFHSSEDYYQKSISVNLTRLIRLIAFVTTILGPAIYIAVITYNQEAIPPNLLISFSTQRHGVPLPTTIEIIMMMIVFEILKETDARAPSAIGSSLSIVGAIVLGQAAVSAGVASPVTIIVVAITAISGLVSYSIDVVQGVRLWRIIFVVAASFLGIFGILVAGFIFIINISSIKSFGLPYLSPIAPFIKGEQDNSIFIFNKRKYEKRNALTAKKNKWRSKYK